jgi:tetratricopeptide (TPR) repeat protein
VTLRQKGAYDEAQAELKAAKGANPNYGPARVQLGLTYYMRGEKELAFREWDEALAANPGLKEARSFLNIFRDRA